jgi:membrane protein YqaA with SNARE-associated domain
VSPILGALGVYAGTFAIAAISSALPLVSIEMFLVGLTLVRGAGDAAAIIACATAGQVLGKLPVYYAVRRLGELPGRQRKWVERIRAWATSTGVGSHAVLAASALLGLPPFSIISTAAGALAIRARTFCLVVALGRALRFALLVYLAA